MATTPVNPLRLFTRDQTAAKVGSAASPYRGHYFQLADGSWVQVSKDYTLAYFGLQAAADAEYELDATFEKGYGWKLYIKPVVKDKPHVATENTVERDSPVVS